MQQKTLFSIIITSYNKELTIEKCIKSVLQQNFNSREIIIIDDNSTDRSLKKIKKFKKKIKLYKNKKNYGVGKSRNIGLDKARGKYIIFLDGDDELFSGSLKKINKEILKNENLDFIITNHKLAKDGKSFKNNINYLNVSKKLKRINNFQRFMGYCWRFIINNDFIKKNKIRFENSRIFEDEDFVGKLIFFVSNFIFSQINLIKHNEYKNSLSDSKKFDDIKTIILLIQSLNHILQKSEKEKNKFLRSRIKIVTEHFLFLCLTLDNFDLKKMSKLFDYYFFNKKIFFLKKNFLINKKNFLHLFLKEIEKKSLINFYKLKNKKILIFCYDRVGKAYANILKNNNFNILGFLDNQFKKGAKYQNSQIYKIDRKLSKIKDLVIIIANQRDDHIRDITKQLVNLNIKKTSLISKRII